jgi:hypothetical protein
MMLESLDGIGSNMLVNISVQRDEETVTMQIGEQLPSRRLWSALILPYNCEADKQVAELSKSNELVSMPDCFLCCVYLFPGYL